jgi:hypothetical protein
MAQANADIAVRAGCTGVIITSLEGQENAVTLTAREIKRRHPGLRVGANYLSLTAQVALERSLENGLDATWSDRPCVTNDGPDAQGLRIAKVLLHNPVHLFFTSVTVKTPLVGPGPEQAALQASKLGMIATTSGLVDGVPVTPQMLYLMRQVLGASPLAGACGITADNASELGHLLSHVLVYTGIEKSIHEFDEVLLNALMARLRRPVGGSDAANEKTHLMQTHEVSSNQLFKRLRAV